MKKLIMIALCAGMFTFSVTSCRDQVKVDERTHTEKVMDDMTDKGADVKIKDDKIKMETEDEKLKIKKESDGDVKIKHKKKE